jgi:hypothetical protein
MSETTQITPETYANILAMANSSDKENKVVALSLVENVDYKSNLTYLLMLKKQADVTVELWKENAPKLCAEFTRLGLDPAKILTYKQILVKLLENKSSQEDMEFFCKYFAVHLKDALSNIGYESVNDLNIEIRLKPNDKGRTTIKSI